MNISGRFFFNFVYIHTYRYIHNGHKTIFEYGVCFSEITYFPSDRFSNSGFLKSADISKLHLKFQPAIYNIKKRSMLFCNSNLLKPFYSSKLEHQKYILIAFWTKYVICLRNWYKICLKSKCTYSFVGISLTNLQCHLLLIQQ